MADGGDQRPVLELDITAGERRLRELQKEWGWDPEAERHTVEEVVTYLEKLEAAYIGTVAALYGMNKAMGGKT